MRRPLFPPSQRATRIHTPVQAPGAPKQTKAIRYCKKDRLGKGSFGDAWKAVDVDSGEFFALKRVNLPEHRLQSRQYLMLKREERLSHVSSVQVLSPFGVSAEQ